MADEKLTQQTELTAPALTDIMYIVDDPDGTPLSKKVTRANLLKDISTTTSQSTSYEIDWLAADLFEITLTGNVTFTFANLAAGASITLLLIQDATGSRTVTWPGGIEWNDGSEPVLQTAANSVNVVVLWVRADGVTVRGTASDISSAIHDNAAGEINAITEKATPVNADLVLIEDSADSYNKKKAQLGNLPGGGGGSLTTAEADLASNVTMTNANQYYDGPSVSLAAGTWFIVGTVTCVHASSTHHMTAKLWDGSTVESSSMNTTTAGARSTITVSGIVSPGSTTTYKISAACNQAGGIIEAAAAVNGAGNNASHIRAVKVA